MKTERKNLLKEMLGYLKVPKEIENNNLKLAIEEGEKNNGIYHLIADLIN